MATITADRAPVYAAGGGAGSPGRIWLLAITTFREAVRKRMVWAVLLLSALFLAFYGWGVVKFKETLANSTGRSGGLPISFAQEVDLLVALGMFIVFFLAAVMGIFASIGTIAGEIDAGTFQAVLPKPIRRWEVVLGKFLGYALMLAAYIALMTGAIAAIVYVITQRVPAQLAQAALVIAVSAWWLLALTVLGSTIFATMANGIIVYMIYGFGLAATSLESIGQLLRIPTLEQGGLIFSILIPSQRLYNYANYLIQPSTNIGFGGSGSIGGTPPSGFIVPFAASYLVLLLIGACLVFRRKDL